MLGVELPLCTSVLTCLAWDWICRRGKSHDSIVSSLRTCGLRAQTKLLGLLRKQPKLSVIA